MANRRRMYLPKRHFALTAPAHRARVVEVKVYDENGHLCAVPACCDCGRAAMTPKHLKRHGQPLFPGPPCAACACKAYAARIGWPGDPAAVEMQMITDPDMRAILSRSH